MSATSEAESIRKTSAAKPRARWTRNISAKIAALPMIATALVIFLGGTFWTVLYSFTDSKLLPRLRWVGLDQYERLWDTSRWIVSIQNLMFFGVSEPFAQGQEIPVRLVFEHAGAIEVTLPVRRSAPVSHNGH